MEERLLYARTAVVVGLTVAVLGCFICLIYSSQVKVGLDEATLAALSTQISRQRTDAARGSITDRSGTALVSDRTRYRVSLDAAQLEGGTVERLLALCRKTGDVWTDRELPITKTTPYQFTNEEIYSYTNASGETTPTRLALLCEIMGWEKTNSATELLEQMAQSFGLDAPDRDAMGVLYSCSLRRNELLLTDYDVVEDASPTLIAAVEEGDFPGVTITAAAERRYHTTYAAHLLGRVGAITAENWSGGEDYRAQGYQMDDLVGLSGVEYAFEHLLRGSDGLVQTTTDIDSGVARDQTVTQALKGADVALTLDLPLQRATEDALAEYVPVLNGNEGGAAAVVIDVSDGSILASASYPTFDPATMDYADAVSALSPLFNRVLQGTYSPGSTYKMVTATAGLETGAISTDSAIPCTGYLDYYDTRFHCWIYRERGGTHSRTESVTQALRDSCNIFFYNLGMEVGIDTLNQYARLYGLGVPTGVELTEATGVNAGPEHAQQAGSTWYGGNVLSAAIGQSDNSFTPLQIANYIATLVNGGTRYSAHLLERITYADGRVEPYRPQVLGRVELSEGSLAAIKAGMRAVAENSGAFARLEEYGIAVGAKTGSAQVTGQTHANGLFVCFAPYDEPEIALCVAVEKGGSGAATAVIAAEILEAYFGLPAKEG